MISPPPPAAPTTPRPTTAHLPPPLLETRGLTAFYGDFQALFGIDFSIARGETVAVIGSNGAGKTTFLRAITGLLPAPHDAILLDGVPIGGSPAHRLVGAGIAMVPEGRKLFASLTVEENLLIGGWSGKAGGGKSGAGKPGGGNATSAATGPAGSWRLDAVYDLFPVLRDRRASPALALSGGQQQMVAIGRALMSNPRLLLCDEISLGLAPVVIRDIYAALPRIGAAGTSLVVVEQNIAQALAAADRVYCFRHGRVGASGRPADFSRETLQAAYFGTGAAA